MSYNTSMTEIDLPIKYTVIKRPVRRARLEYNRSGLRVIIPTARNFDIPVFLNQFKPWIVKKQLFYEKLKLASTALVLENRSETTLLEILKEFVSEAELAMNVSATEIRLRAMRRQWGNCTNRGRITFNKRLQKLPEHLIRYIVYHETCHLRSLRHGKLFHKIMLKFFPDIKKYEQQLSVYGFRLGIEE